MAQVQELDTTSGAPLKVRAVVGNFDDPERRLKALQEYYPDAVPYGDDNFIFTSDDGVPTVYNNESWVPDIGDLVSVGRDIVSTIAGGTSAVATAVGGQLGPQVFSPEELVTVPAAYALASEGVGQLYDRAIDRFVPDVGRGGVVEQTKKAGGNIAAEIIGGKAVQNVAKFAGERVPDVVKNVLAGGRSNRENILEKIKVGDRIDADVGTLGLATRSPALLNLEKRLSQIPFSQNQMYATFDNIRKGSSELLNTLSKKYSSSNQVSSPEDIGILIKAGAETTTEKFNKKSEKLYDDAFELVPNAKGRVNNIMELRVKLQRELEKAPKSLKNIYKSAFDEIDKLTEDSINKGGIDLITMRNLRTFLRESIPDLRTVGRTNEQAKLKEVLDALTKDIFESVQGTPAESLMKKADTFYARVTKKDGLRDVLSDIMSKDDIKVFNMWTSGTKVGVRDFKKILNIMPVDNRGEVKAKFIRNLGYAKPAGVTDSVNDFSTQTFLTNWDNLSTKSKVAMFGSKSNPIWNDLDDIVKSFKDIQFSESFTNYSKTGDSILGVTAISAAITPLIGVGTGAMSVGAGGAAVASIYVTPKVAARLMTNPDFIKWLAKSAPRIGESRKAFSYQVGRLIEASTSDAQFRDDVADYVQALSSTVLGGSSAEAATVPNEVVTTQNEVVTEDNSSPTLESIIGGLNPSASNKILAASNAR